MNRAYSLNQNSPFFYDRCGLMLILTTNLAVWMSAVTDESVHKAESKKPDGNISHRMGKLTRKHKNYDKMNLEGITLRQRSTTFPPWQPGPACEWQEHACTSPSTSPSTKHVSTMELHTCMLACSPLAHHSWKWNLACARTCITRAAQFQQAAA